MNIKTKSNLIFAFFLFIIIILSYNFLTTETASKNMSRVFSTTWIDNITQLSSNIKENKAKLQNNYNVKHLVQLDLIPKDFNVYINNEDLEYSHIKADAGIRIYLKHNHNSMYLQLENVTKISCYYYSNGLRNNKIISNIIINSIPLNQQSSDDINCNASNNIIELII